MGTLIAGPAKDSLNLTSPETVLAIHRQYLEAGADILKTNTFNSNSGPAGYEINAAGARLAREAADEFTKVNPFQPRYVAGSVGPAGDGFYEQARGLIDGGADLLLAETMTSIPIALAALSAFETLFAQTGRELPVMLSVTISQTGGLPSGETLEAFWKSVAGRKFFSVGINCGFGARHVGPYIAKLAALASTRVSCHPSAGLPNASGSYDESPAEFAGILHGFAEQGFIDIAGGCCGTTPAHIRAVADAVRGIPRATIDRL